MGLLKSLLKLKFYVILFGAGYVTHSCVAADERYKIKRIEHSPYLVDIVSGKELRIYSATAQVGSVEHRLRGLLKEKDLAQSLEALTKQLEVKK